MNLDKQSLAIDATVDNKQPVVECPFCSEFIYYDWADADGIGEEIGTIDCPHYIGTTDENDRAIFLTLDLKAFWLQLRYPHSPVHCPTGIGWYQIRCNFVGEHKCGYLAVRILGSVITKIPFQWEHQAAMWCVEDVLNRKRERE